MFALVQFNLICHAQDDSRVLKSIIFPGMGQLGDGQTVKGLSYMTGEVLCLTLFFSQMSKWQSSARQTIIFNDIKGNLDSYSELKQMQVQWEEAKDKNKKSKVNMFIFGTVAAAFWGLNVADAIYLKPTNDENTGLSHLKNTQLSIDSHGATLKYILNF